MALIRVFSSRVEVPALAVSLPEAVLDPSKTHTNPQARLGGLATQFSVFGAKACTHNADSKRKTNGEGDEVRLKIERIMREFTTSVKAFLRSCQSFLEMSPSLTY